MRLTCAKRPVVLHGLGHPDPPPCVSQNHTGPGLGGRESPASGPRRGSDGRRPMGSRCGLYHLRSASPSPAIDFCFGPSGRAGYHLMAGFGPRPRFLRGLFRASGSVAVGWRPSQTTHGPPGLVNGQGRFRYLVPSMTIQPRGPYYWPARRSIHDAAAGRPVHGGPSISPQPRETSSTSHTSRYALRRRWVSPLSDLGPALLRAFTAGHRRPPPAPSPQRFAAGLRHGARGFARHCTWYTSVFCGSQSNTGSLVPTMAWLNILIGRPNSDRPPRASRDGPKHTRKSARSAHWAHHRLLGTRSSRLGRPGPGVHASGWEAQCEGILNAQSEPGLPNCV